MKKLILAVLFLTAVNLNAQNADFGIKAGLNYGSTGDFESFSQVVGDASTKINSDNRVGYHAGFFAQFQVLGIFIQPELLYTHINTEYNDFDYKLNKIDAPVLVGLNILGPLNIKAGPSFQYIFNNDLENTDLKIGDVEKEISVGYQLGAGLELGRLGFDIRYEGAFNENDAFGEAATDNNFKIDSRISQWILSLSYKL